MLDREGAWGAVELASRHLLGALPLDGLTPERVLARPAPAVALPDLRSLAKSNMAAETKSRRRALAMVVAAVLAVCVWAVVHYVL